MISCGFCDQGPIYLVGIIPQQFGRFHICAECERMWREREPMDSEHAIDLYPLWSNTTRHPNGQTSGESMLHKLCCLSKDDAPHLIAYKADGVTVDASAFVVNMGNALGTGGQQMIRIAFEGSEAQKIIRSAYPVFSQTP